MKNKIRAALVGGTITAAAFLLVACGSPQASTNAGGLFGQVTYHDVETPRGNVPCLVYYAGNQGGLSCDWDALDG